LLRDHLVALPTCKNLGMSIQTDNKGQLLAEGIAWREAGRLDEARDRMLDLSRAYPDDGIVAYQTAWVHDLLGLENEAVPYYLKALSSDQLGSEDRLSALTGCGSTLRFLGRCDEAVELLEGALAEFPDDGGLAAFLAMALYNVGRHHDATRMLLRLIAASSTAPNITRYRAAIEYYAEDLNMIEGVG
jgi:tetratricopeptide (TPR) repeat protein